jgi:hypothetical protein
VTLTNFDETGQLDGVEAQLIATFSPPLRPEVIQRCLFEVIASFENAPVRSYLSVLVERVATTRLQAVVSGEPCGVESRIPSDATARRSRPDSLPSEGGR